MIERQLKGKLDQYLDFFPVVGLLGPRRVGKTTLARALMASSSKPTTYLDLERDTDLAKLHDPELYLQRHVGRLLIIDEIQRRPSLFPLLRSLVDERRRANEPAPYFLVLGSASRDLLRQSSESLAGRIGYLELCPLSVGEVGELLAEKLWLRGGFPESFLAPSDELSEAWRGEFIATFLERDLNQLGFNYPATQIRRLWEMLAHNHGQPLNVSKLAGNLGLGDREVRRYIDTLSDLFMIRQLQPWSPNSGKRVRKRPKVYLRDSGLLHRLARISSAEVLMGHPLIGASWEGFVLETLIQRAGDAWSPFYYRTAGGAELDLLLIGPGERRIAIEIKRSSTPKISRGFRSGSEDVSATERYYVVPTDDTYPLDRHTMAVGPMFSVTQS
jgi:predicted AAA+ superfamily ATPase